MFSLYIFGVLYFRWEVNRQYFEAIEEILARKGLKLDL